MSVARENIVEQIVAEINLSGSNILKSADHSEDCGFSAAAWTIESDKFSVCDVKREIFDRHKSVRINFI